MDRMKNEPPATAGSRRLCRSLIAAGLVITTFMALWAVKCLKGTSPVAGPSALYVMLLSLGASLLVGGIGIWIRQVSSPWKRLQRCAAALICLVLYGGAVAGILLAIYFSWCNRENGICREAAQRPTLAERREMLESARGWEEFLFGDAMRKISWCRMTWNDLDRLERDGACPLFPLRGVPCRCGTDAWPADLKCKGPVVCTYGRLEESLRCAGPDEF